MAAPSIRRWCRHVLVELRSLTRSAVLIGAGNSLRAVAYASRRAALDRSLPVPASPPRSPGALRSAEQTGVGARFGFDQATLDLRPIPGGVFVGWDGAEPTLPSYAVEQEPDPARPGEQARLEQVGDGWSITAGELHFFSKGRLVRHDTAPEWTAGGWIHRSRLDAGQGLSTTDSAVFGLGGRSTRPNRRPGAYRLWNTERGGRWLLARHERAVGVRRVR